MAFGGGGRGRGRGRGKDRKVRRGPPRGERRFFRRKSCKLCGEKEGGIDFRDTARLCKFTSERGKILPRRISGNCSRHQRELARAVKRARVLALMPYLAAE